MATVPTGLQTCAKTLQIHLSGVGGHLECNPKVTENLKKPHHKKQSFWLLILDLDIFIIVATVPTGLQTCAKMLQMHLSGGGGTPRLQPKSNGKFTIASAQLVRFLAAAFGFKYFHYSSHCAHRVANLCKNAANAPFRGGGTPWMQPKSNEKFLLASSKLVKFLDTDFGFKYFHYSGHCAHRFTNLCKNAANAPFRGWGDT